MTKPNQSEQEQVQTTEIIVDSVPADTAPFDTVPVTPAVDVNSSLVAAIERVARPGDDSSWDLATKRTVLVIMLVGVIYVTYISRNILPMVLVAGIVSYLLNPIVNLAARFKIPRAISTLVIYLIVIIALVVLPIIFVPALVDQLRALGNFNVPGTARAVINWLNDTVRSLPAEIVVLGYALPLGQYIGQIQENSRQIQFIPSVNDILNYIQNLLSTTTTVVGSTFNIGVSVVGGIFSVFLTVLVTFFVSLYMTIDAPRIQAYIHDLFPSSYRSELADLLRRIGHVWQAFLRGQLILSITVGAATYLALILVGMPGALLFAILAGLLEVVPNLGPILAMIPAVIMALIQGSDMMREVGINNLGFAAITVGIYFLIQQLENNILVPRIIGESVNLHPIIVICAVAVGLTTGGILGALLAPPVAASFRVIGSYVHAKLLDYPPFKDRHLANAPPRTYRRKMSRRELEARRKQNDEATDVPSGTLPAREASARPNTAAASAPPSQGDGLNGNQSDRAPTPPPPHPSVP
ncbi:MAG: AI-2E family transporter [Caldilinea sp.]|nr:AI-2E family transporter [Anaerolineales bacterium]